MTKGFSLIFNMKPRRDTCVTGCILWEGSGAEAVCQQACFFLHLGCPQGVNALPEGSLGVIFPVRKRAEQNLVVSFKYLLR